MRIHRVHLEEDAAKLSHVGESGRIHGSGASLVDFNRGGTPLVEIVTEPDIHDPAAAREWLGLLRTTLRQLGVSDVNMEEGSLRCDANVSIRPAGQRRARHEDRAEEHEQLPLPRARRRGRDRAAAGPARGRRDRSSRRRSTSIPRSGSLTPLRSKEYSHDYRYFPEPDLPPLAPTEAQIEAARDSLPELPEQRRERYESELGLSAEQATRLAFDAELGDFFERALAAGDGGRGAGRWRTG